MRKHHAPSRAWASWGRQGTLLSFLSDFVRFGGAEALSLANWALLRRHQIEGDVEAAAQKNEQQPVEFLRGNNITVAKVTVLGRAHIFSVESPIGVTSCKLRLAQ